MFLFVSVHNHISLFCTQYVNIDTKKFWTFYTILIKLSKLKIYSQWIILFYILLLKYVVIIIVSQRSYEVRLRHTHIAVLRARVIGYRVYRHCALIALRRAGRLRRRPASPRLASWPFQLHRLVLTQFNLLRTKYLYGLKNMAFKYKRCCVSATPPKLYWLPHIARNYFTRF